MMEFKDLIEDWTKSVWVSHTSFLAEMGLGRRGSVTPIWSGFFVRSTGRGAVWTREGAVVPHAVSLKRVHLDPRFFAQASEGGILP